MTTIDENDIGKPKILNNFCCTSNIRLFSITPQIVITLPTLGQQKLSQLISLLLSILIAPKLFHILGEPILFSPPYISQLDYNSNKYSERRYENCFTR